MERDYLRLLADPEWQEARAQAHAEQLQDQIY